MSENQKCPLQAGGKSVSKKKRLELSLSQKVQLIKTSVGKRQRQLAEEFKIGLGTVSRILANRNRLLREYEQSTNSEQRRVRRKSRHEGLNDALWKWFQSARGRKIPVSGSLIQVKTLEFAEQLGYQDFKASNGWLESFRKRHMITFRALTGEGNYAPRENVKEFSQRLPTIASAFRMEDVFSCDESGLFY